MREDLEREFERAVNELKKEPETLTECLPDVIFVSDTTQELDACEDEERFFGASEKRDDLVGCGRTAVVGIYKLIAVQELEKSEKVTTLATEFAAPGTKELELDLGHGGVTVADD